MEIKKALGAFITRVDASWTLEEEGPIFKYVRTKLESKFLTSPDMYVVSITLVQSCGTALKQIT